MEGSLDYGKLKMELCGARKITTFADATMTAVGAIRPKRWSGVGPMGTEDLKLGRRSDPATLTQR